MKCILFLILILLFSSSLFPGTGTKITAKAGHWLTIGLGAKDGVKVDLKGKVQQIVIDNGTPIAFNIGIFVVKKVAEDSAELYIEKVGTNAQLDKADQVEFYDTLKKSTPSEQLIEMKNKWEAYLKKKQFKEAGEVLAQASKLKPGDNDINALSEGIAFLNALKIDVQNYIEHKEKYPASPILNDVKKKLYELNPDLPQGKYLDNVSTITKNNQGYYEMRFKNSHIMVYIPEMKLFADKYEVSNFQYLQFAGQKGTPMEKINFSTKELMNYPDGCETYPAILSYDQAEDYCSKNGMRLPSEAEWEYIAGKEKGLTYSWGNQNVDEGGIYRANYEALEDGYLELATVDKYSEYASPYGTLNMSGNVSEWVQGNESKGGGFLSEPEELKISNKSNKYGYTGFRCVMEISQ